MGSLDRYEMLQYICFEIQGKKLDPDKANPLLSEFHTLLEESRFKDGSISAMPTAVDEFAIEEIDTTLLRGQYLIRWDIVDMDEAGAASRYNNFIHGALTKHVQGIMLDNGGRYGKKITISV